MRKAKSKYPKYPLLIVDDEIEVLNALETVLIQNGINNIKLCDTPQDVMKLLERQEFCLALLDLKMPGMSGEQLLPMIIQKFPYLPVIILSGNPEIETAVRCVKNNAYDYLVKPVDESHLIACLKRGINFREIEFENQYLKKSILSEEFEYPEIFQQLMTKNHRMISLYRYAEAIASSPAPLLLTGETGSGRHFMAHIVHLLSHRSGDLIYINTDELDDLNFQIRIFGQVLTYQSGSFPAQTEGKKLAAVSKDFALFQAQEGMLYFNEIANISPENQIELLNVIKSGKYLRPAVNTYKRADVRFVFASQYNPFDLMEGKRLRYDFYNMICGNTMEIPPLRKRSEDLPLLLEHFINLAAEEHSKIPPKYANEVILMLSALPFLNNVSELKQLVFQVVKDLDVSKLRLEHFEPYLNQDQNISSQIMQDLFYEERSSVASWQRLPTMQEMERILIQETMKRTGNNRSVAAKVLGITRQTLVKYLPQE